MKKQADNILKKVNSLCCYGSTNIGNGAKAKQKGFSRLHKWKTDELAGLRANFSFYLQHKRGVFKDTPHFELKNPLPNLFYLAKRAIEYGCGNCGDLSALKTLLAITQTEYTVYHCEIKDIRRNEGHALVTLASDSEISLLCAWRNEKYVFPTKKKLTSPEIKTFIKEKIEKLWPKIYQIDSLSIYALKKTQQDINHSLTYDGIIQVIHYGKQEIAEYKKKILEVKQSAQRSENHRLIDSMFLYFAKKCAKNSAVKKNGLGPFKGIGLFCSDAYNKKTLDENLGSKQVGKIYESNNFLCL
jgi:hypothetical protein